MPKFPKLPSSEERFWARVAKADGCWVWLGKKNGDGYGMFTIDGRIRAAHRVSWEMSHSPIPAGLFVCHTCDNPPCVRPDHLWLGTNADNVADRDRKGRAKGHPTHGELHPGAKLKAADVYRMFDLSHSGVPQRTIAKMLGVSHQVVGTILVGKRWTHLGIPPIRRRVRTNAV